MTIISPGALKALTNPDLFLPAVLVAAKHAGGYDFGVDTKERMEAAGFMDADLELWGDQTVALVSILSILTGESVQEALVRLASVLKKYMTEEEILEARNWPAEPMPASEFVAQFATELLS